MEGLGRLHFYVRQEPELKDPINDSEASMYLLGTA